MNMKKRQRKSVPNKTNGVKKPTKTKVFSNVLTQMEKLCSSYDQFLIPNEKTSEKYKNCTKSLYDLQSIKSNQFQATIFRTTDMKPLNQLLIKGFDNEQIWQQMNLFNRPLMNYLVKEISVLSSRKAKLALNIVMSNDKDDSDSMTKLKKKENAIVAKSSELNNTKKVKFPEEIIKKDELTCGNDSKIDFFDLNEMEAFLDGEDKKAMDDQTKNDFVDDENLENDIDYFAEIPSDSDDAEDDKDEPMYLDFFDPPKITTTIEKVENSDEEDDEEEEEQEFGKDDNDDDDELDIRDFDDMEMENVGSVDENILRDASSSDDDDMETEFDSVNRKLKALANNQEDELINDPNKSEFERSQTMLKKKIEKAERELLHPSNLHWQMAGETTGDVRPENSLLEEHLQFDHVTRPAPMITDKTTNSLEAIIKQRIKDNAFDDVERKVKPTEQPFEFRRRIMIESEKSKVGLAEVYEQEFAKKQQQLKDQDGNGVGSSMFAAPGEVEETETRKEIRVLMQRLFRKLDSLSAFHYTPRLPEPEVKILSNMATVSVEEVTPDTVGDMKLLAPEEVFNTRGKKVLQAKGERSDTDRKRARRLKKKKQSFKQKQMEKKEKVKSTSVNKMEITALKSNKEKNSINRAFSSSTKFFERLQDAKESDKTFKNEKRKKRQSSDSNLGKKLKL
ncbi:u3 small nucleolar ribonucleoprotein MPP10 [Blomia tropicalis]|nr:u3 small nucleolar ribonucleoprotein MPP10 [Blomia tropicalis]